jgi:hypothetical protein
MKLDRGDGLALEPKKQRTGGKSRANNDFADFDTKSVHMDMDMLTLSQKE